MPTATSIGIVPPTEQVLYTHYAKKLNFPKSFGLFFANSYLDHTEKLRNNYRVVCAQNRWKHTRFRYYNTMVRWLMSNNAPRETIEGVLDMALVHRNALKKNLGLHYHYGTDDNRYLESYDLIKYSGFRTHETFDYTKVPRSNSKSDFDDF